MYVSIVARTFIHAHASEFNGHAVPSFVDHLLRCIALVEEVWGSLLCKQATAAKSSSKYRLNMVESNFDKQPRLGCVKHTERNV